MPQKKQQTKQLHNKMLIQKKWPIIRRNTKQLRFPDKSKQIRAIASSYNQIQQFCNKETSPKPHK